MQTIIDGYRRFRAKGWTQQRELFQSLAEQGQRPKFLVVACVDSRVDPAIVFDAMPGEMLTIRNVANLVPPYEPDASYHGTSAALEFGVRILGVEHLVVLGHGLCGGVRALLNGVPDEAQDFILPWMAIATEARVRAMRCTGVDERQECCEQEVVKTSIANLGTYPWIAERVAAKQLKLHGAWFSISTGDLMLLQAGGGFTRLANTGS